MSANQQQAHQSPEETAPETPPKGCDWFRVTQTFRKDERWGVWSDHTLKTYTGRVRDLPGDFAEIGVFRGATFHRLTALAQSQGKIAHAFDSFVGMDEPGEHDRGPAEAGAHLPGKFDVGGPEGFARLMDDYGIERDSYKLWAGWVPDCFTQAPQDLQFSIVILDVDHYQPTVDGLAWLWPRIVPGGYIMLDDCALDWDRESTRAIKEFLAADNQHWLDNYYNNQLMLRKLPQPVTLG